MTEIKHAETEQATPSGVRVIAIATDGTERNITEGVQALYDLVISSMDWGSHFLAVEEVDPIVGLARFCGFKDFEEAETYVEAERRAEKQRHCAHGRRQEEPIDAHRADAFKYVNVVCLDCGRKWVDQAGRNGPTDAPIETRQTPRPA